MAAMSHALNTFLHFSQLFLPAFISTWLICYGVLAGLYLLMGYSARLSRYRIQSKDCPQELIKRDIKQSLKSLVTIAALLAGGLALRQIGVTITGLDESTRQMSWIGYIGWAAVSLVFFDTWFYWAHRLIHHKRLYIRIHRWHHRSSTPTVWANNSDTFLDNLFCQSYWFFAPLLLPIPTLILLIHKLYDQVTGMIGHAGYEYAPGAFSAKPSPMIGTSFHDLHHSAFHYNFATHFSIWDRLMGTVHPDYDRLIRSFPHKNKKDNTEALSKSAKVQTLDSKEPSL